MKRLDRVEARARLERRRDPYWHRLAEGRYVGFRKMPGSGPGTWLARFYDGDRNRQQPLGDFAALPERERFDAAKKAAEAWFAHMDAGGAPGRGATVRDACEAYLAKLRSERSEAATVDPKGRFRRLVYSDPIGRVALAKLAPRHVAEWKSRVLASGSRGGFNRNATALRAALNLARDRREVASDTAWRVELRPLEGVDGRRELYLDAVARRALVAAANPEIRPFLEALTLVPLRPGELAALRVDDLDLKHRVLRVPTGKVARRDVPLGERAFAHFRAQARGQHPQAWLVRRSNGERWRTWQWGDEIKLAAAAAKLPRATVAYTLRHSTITDLVAAGVDLFTIGRIAGTSIRMVEKHYGHLQREHARAALEKLAS